MSELQKQENEFKLKEEELKKKDKVLKILIGLIFSLFKLFFFSEK